MRQIVPVNVQRRQTCRAFERDSIVADNDNVVLAACRQRIGFGAVADLQRGSRIEAGYHVIAAAINETNIRAAIFYGVIAAESLNCRTGQSVVERFGSRRSDDHKRQRVKVHVVEESLQSGLFGKIAQEDITARIRIAAAVFGHVEIVA